MAPKTTRNSKELELSALLAAGEELLEMLSRMSNGGRGGLATRRARRKLATHLRLALAHARAACSHEGSAGKADRGSETPDADGPEQESLDDLFPELQSSLGTILQRRLECMAEEPLDEDATPSFAQRDPPGLHGYSACLPVPQLVISLCSNYKTGVLDILFEGEMITLWFSSGDLVHATRNVSRPGERLGDRLVERGAIQRDQLEKILAANVGHKRIGELLLSSGEVSEEDLSLALRDQYEAIFLRLSRPDPCSYCFRDGLPPNFEKQIRLNVTQLLLESARQHDEDEDEQHDKQPSLRPAGSEVDRVTGTR